MTEVAMGIDGRGGAGVPVAVQIPFSAQTIRIALATLASAAAAVVICAVSAPNARTPAPAPSPVRTAVPAPAAAKHDMARAVTGFDVARRWAEDWALLYAAENRDQHRAYANAWPPAGGVAVLMSNRLPPAAQEATVAAAANTPSAANMPSAAKAHIAAIERTVPLPPSVPPAMHSDRGKHRSTGRKTPLHIEPKVAALPPQAPEPGYFNFFRKLFVDPNDEAAHALLAANPQTAIYDIKDHVVYLPGGTKLEAHSGYGKWLDDPSSVRRKDLGVTPPNVYSVSFREKLFHGVRALRLTPVGDGNMYGRDGMLAHTYMLGRNGQSNGCVSVKDYQKFLQAYEHGKFNRLIVVRSVEDSTPAQVASAAPGNV